MSRPRLDVRDLTPLERLQLLEEIWGILSNHPDSVPLSDAQRTELDRRLDNSDRDSVPGIPWDEVLEKVRQQKK